MEEGNELRRSLKKGEKKGIMLGSESFGIRNEEVGIEDEMLNLKVNKDLE